MKILCCMIALSLPILGRSADAPAGPKPAGPKLTRSVAFDWSDLTAEPRPNGERRDAFNAPTVSLGNFACHITTLNVGENSGAVITHDVGALAEKAILIKDGAVEVTINDTKKTVGSGGVIYFAPGDRTFLRNAGKTSATYFVITVIAASSAGK